MMSTCLFGFFDLDDVGGLPLPSLCLASRSRRWRSLRFRSSSGLITLLLMEDSEFRLILCPRDLCCSGVGGSAKMSSSGPRGFAPVRGR